MCRGPGRPSAFCFLIHCSSFISLPRTTFLFQPVIERSKKGPPSNGQAMCSSFFFQLEADVQLSGSVIRAEGLPGMCIHIQKFPPQVRAVDAQLPQFTQRLQRAAPAGYPPEDVIQPAPVKSSCFPPLSSPTPRAGSADPCIGGLRRRQSPHTAPAGIASAVDSDVC